MQKISVKMAGQVSQKHMRRIIGISNQRLLHSNGIGFLRRPPSLPKNSCQFTLELLQRLCEEKHKLGRFRWD